MVFRFPMMDMVLILMEVLINLVHIVLSSPDAFIMETPKDEKSYILLKYPLRTTY